MAVNIQPYQPKSHGSGMFFSVISQDCVEKSSYWQSGMCRGGMFLLEQFKNCLFLLMPPALVDEVVREVKLASHVNAFRTKAIPGVGIVLEFEDNSNAPFQLHLRQAAKCP